MGLQIIAISKNGIVTGTGTASSPGKFSIMVHAMNGKKVKATKVVMDRAVEMVMEMAEIIAVRKVIISLILFSIPILKLNSEQLLIFSEVSNGLHLEKMFTKQQEKELFTTISTELQTSRTRFAIDGSIYSFANLDSLSNWQTSIIYEQLFSLIDFSLSGDYLDDENDTLDVTKTTVQLFKQQESLNNFSEYGFMGKKDYYYNNKVFSNLEFNLYYINKKFMRNYTLHHEFNFITKYFKDIDPLITLNYQIIFSFPTSNQSGMSLSYFINYSPINTDELVYLNEELFDLFSYNMHKLSLEYTVETSNLLFKPWLTINNRDYLQSAVEYSYSETSFLAGFYTDWLLADKLMTYAEGFYQTIVGEKEIAYEFKTGIKFQFDIKSH